MTFTTDLLVTNSLIDLLSDIDRSALIKLSEVVNHLSGDTFGDQSNEIQYVFFPLKSIFSWLKVIDQNTALAVALIGSEGMLCITPLMGVTATPCRAIVCKSGTSLRIKVSCFMKLLRTRPKMEEILKRYAYVLFSQIIQTTACAHFHTIEQRLARVLLMLKDRSKSINFHITQESLSHMLGVRRVGVTKSAVVLQNKKVISYSRGDLIIHDANELEMVACKCYKADLEIYNQTLIAR